MHAMLLAVQGSVWWVTETQETMSRSPEIWFEAATLANRCNIQHNTQTHLSDVESLFLAAWRFSVLLEPSARRSWHSHILIQLGMEVVDIERRRVGWQGQRRKETNSLSQLWGAESNTVRPHTTVEPWHPASWLCPLPCHNTLSIHTRDDSAGHLFFTGAGQRLGFLCLALVWLVVFCHPYGSKAISNFGKLLRIYPLGLPWKSGKLNGFQRKNVNDSLPVPKLCGRSIFKCRS